jgi:hypothetical protein
VRRKHEVDRKGEQWSEEPDDLLAADAAARHSLIPKPFAARGQCSAGVQSGFGACQCHMPGLSSRMRGMLVSAHAGIGQESIPARGRNKA